MINLTPNQEKKEMLKDFYLRLVIVFLIATSFSFFVATSALLPSYFLSSLRKDLNSQNLENQKKIALPSSSLDTLSLINELDHKLSLVEDNNLNKFVVSERVINEIIFKKPSYIKINQIYYTDNGVQEKTINIQGTASSRDELSRFRIALENDKNFKSVDLPFSNFIIKGSNIQFSIKLIPS